jgi:hypothetical protein
MVSQPTPRSCRCLFSSPGQNRPGAIHRALCDGSDRKSSLATNAVALLLLFFVAVFSGSNIHGCPIFGAQFAPKVG